MTKTRAEVLIGNIIALELAAVEVNLKNRFDVPLMLLGVWFPTFPPCLTVTKLLSVHWSDPWTLKLLGGHATHMAIVFAPITSLYVPATHILHVVCVGAELYHP
jgi:hypothetical protein